MNGITRQEYYSQVALMALEITKAAREEDRDITDVLHETVDGHQWIIYTAYNLDVLKHSSNESAYFDNFGAITAEDFSSLTAQLAYAAFAQDVTEHANFNAK